MAIKFITRNWSVESLAQKRDAITLSPPYQRNSVWKTKHKQLFLDSIVRGYPVPDMFFYENENGITSWDVIDGQQRTSAIWDFVDNKFRFSRDAEDVDGMEIANKRFKDLHPVLQTRIKQYELPIKFLLVGEYEQADMFSRLGNSVPLSPAEKRHAITGAFQQYIVDTVANHPLFNVITVKDERFAFETIAAQLVSMESTDVLSTHAMSANYLFRLYVDYRKGDAFSDPKFKALLKRVKSTMDYMAAMFNCEPSPTMRNIMHVQALYAFVHFINRMFEQLPPPIVTGKWFEQLYHSAKEHIKLPVNEIELRIAYFISQSVSGMAGAKETGISAATAHNIRVQYMIDEFRKAFPDLQEAASDNPRLFSYSQRVDIFHRSNKRCQICNTNISWRNWHADHIIPYSKGGKTEVSNGQALCPTCNLKKSNKVIANE